jgi:leucyl-tRNA synthetase
MEFTNALGDRQREGHWQTAAFHQSLETLLVLIAPAAPHLAEELWQRTGHAGSVHAQAWPGWDPNLGREEIAQVAVQVNSRLRAVIDVAPDAPQAEVEAAALAHPKVQPYLAGREQPRIFYVPGKVINIVL